MPTTKRKAAPARATPAKKRVLTVPVAFLKAIKANKKATTAFNAFPHSHRKEYVEWVAAAKAPATRDRRIKAAVASMAAGNGRRK